MTCKGICIRYKAQKPVGTGRYASGQRRCQICEIFIKWEGLWCPCCGYRLRTKPRNLKYKAKLRARVEADSKIAAEIQPVVEETVSKIKNADFIDTSNDYASLFVLIRGKDAIEEYMLKTGEYVGGAVLVTIGAKLIAVGIGGIIAPEPITTVVGAVAVIGGTISTAVGGIAAITGSLTGVHAYLADIGEPQLLLMTPFIEYNSEELNNLGCNEFPVYRK